MSPRPPKWFLWERVFPSDYKCSRENRAGQLAVGTRFSIGLQMQPGKSSRTTRGNAFFHRTTNAAGKIEPDNWPVVRLDFPGCICSPMEKRVPTKWIPALIFITVQLDYIFFIYCA
jgi:hypothetical protein